MNSQPYIHKKQKVQAGNSIYRKISCMLHSDVNKDLGFKAKAKDLGFKANDLEFKAKDLRIGP